MRRRTVDTVGVVITDSDFNIKYINSSASEYIVETNISDTFAGNPFLALISGKRDFANEKVRIYRTWNTYDLCCSGEFENGTFCFVFESADALGAQNRILGGRPEFNSIIRELHANIMTVNSSIGVLVSDYVSKKDDPAMATAKTGMVRIMKILSGLNGISGIEEKRTQLNKEYFDLVRLVREITEGVFGYMDGSFVSFSLHGRDELMVFADYYHIQRTLVNVISSMLYNDSGAGEIDIDISSGKTVAVVRIKNDNCPAADRMIDVMNAKTISSSVRSKIDRVDEIGLLYARKCVEFNGGNMTAKKTNSGIRFEIQIPFEKCINKLCSPAYHRPLSFDFELFDILEKKRGAENG